MKSKKPQTRSERIRAKRQSGIKPSAPRRRRKQSGSGRGIPPVMVREVRTAHPARRPKKKSKLVKRRFDIALPTPGVEVRLPSLPTVRPGWRLLSSLLVLLLSAVLYYIFNSPMYRVHEVQMDGLARLSSDTISRSLLVYNRSVFMIEPEVLEDRIINIFPGVVSASVRVGFPAIVEVEIEEREPVIAWEQNEDVHWVDAQGMAFPPRGEAENLVRVLASTSPPAPFVLEEVESTTEGDETLRAFMSPEMAASIIALSGIAPDGVPLVFDERHGFGWRDPGGWDVYFGAQTSDAAMATKLAIYEAAVQRLSEEGIRPTLISLEYLHAPYYRMEQ
ncbi:MAG: FtsQ-type POTRA domain-containing protein [Chloroflexi bacterium]|nr:FtsQ-type POTRA domain-containing protein [Chloroflexota bacterium]